MVAISEPETYGGTEIASQVTEEVLETGLANIAKREKRKEARKEKGKKFLQNVKELNPQLLKNFIDKRKAKKADSTGQAVSDLKKSAAAADELDQVNERMMRMAGIERKKKSEAQPGKPLQESISRGELYRRRYYGRY